MDERRYMVLIKHTGETEMIRIEDLSGWFGEAKRLAGIRYAEEICPLGQEYPCLIDEDGKARELPLNKKATGICRTILAEDDYISGNMLIGHLSEDALNMEPLTSGESEHLIKELG